MTYFVGIFWCIRKMTSVDFTLKAVFSVILSVKISMNFDIHKIATMRFEVIFTSTLESILHSIKLPVELKVKRTWLHWGVGVSLQKLDYNPNPGIDFCEIYRNAWGMI
jgi:hypothetical protein